VDLIGQLLGGGFLFTLVAFVVALSVIVAVHEYGHYIVGRWCGIHAEVFSLGFGKVLFSWIDRHGTRWQIAALPFGGYVKFLGDADGASAPDHEFMAKMDPSGIERTMHGAKLWKRSATVAAGPVFNFILSIVVFTAVIIANGKPTDDLTIAEIKPLPAEIGGGALRDGDRIVAVDGTPVSDLLGFFEAMDKLPPGKVSYEIERDGARMTVEGPYGTPPVADGVTFQSAAIAAGLEAGDVILSVDGRTMFSFSELQDAVGQAGGSPVDLVVWRDGTTFESTLTPKRTDTPLPEGGFETRWLIGVTNDGLFFQTATEPVGVLKATQYGVLQTWSIMANSLSALGHVVTGAISPCNLQGPVGIAQVSGQAASQGLEVFIWFIAVLSTAVGMLNLFPIPVLDGGHLLFHAWEAVARRPPSDGALKVMMTAGLALVLTFMVFALTNDFLCP